MTRLRTLLLTLAAAAALAGCSSTPAPSTPAAASSPTATSAAPSPTPTYCASGRLASGYCAGDVEAPPSAAPTSALPPLTELATCRQIVPLLNTVADVATALGKGTSPDVGQLQSVESQLRQIRDRAPENMRIDIDVVIQSTTTMQVGNLDGTSLQQSAIKLLQRCRKYAA